MEPTTSAADNGRDPDQEPRLVRVFEDGTSTQYAYEYPKRSPHLKVEHDPEERAFRIVQPDGTTRVFRDDPVHFLVAVRNPKTGEVAPMMRYGEPEYLYLCREERERE